MSDQELLDQYRQSHSQQAFAELVRKHVDWVHSAACRQVHDAHLAEDVTQAVFLTLAEQAENLKLSADRPLAAWLLRVARYTATKALRSETRRKKHEQKAAAMASTSHETLSDDQWEQIAAHLDELVDKLPARDRHVILLRFYQQMSMAEVGGEVGISEAAAKQRVSRAVDKLRGMLKGKGLVVGSTALAGAMVEKLTTAVPAGMAAKVALVAAGTVSSSVAALAKGAMKMMVWAKVKVATVVVVLVSCLAGVAWHSVMAQLGGGSAPKTAIKMPSTQAGSLDLDFVKAAVSAAEKSIPPWDARSRVDTVFYHPRLRELNGPAETSYGETRVAYVSMVKWRVEGRLFDLQGKLLMENWHAADGKRAMTYQPFREGVNGNLHPNGRIWAISHPRSSLSPQDFLLNNVELNRGMSELLAKYPAKIVSSQLDGSPRTITIQVDSNPTVVVTLDADRGFALVRNELLKSDGKPDKVYDKVVLKRVGEFWFPISGEETTFLDLPALGGYAKAMVKRFTVDESSLTVGQKLDESLFRFEYAKGTYVADDLAGVSYFVGEPAGSTVTESSVKDLGSASHNATQAPAGSHERYPPLSSRLRAPSSSSDRDQSEPAGNTVTESSVRDMGPAPRIATQAPGGNRDPSSNLGYAVRVAVIVFAAMAVVIAALAVHRVRMAKSRIANRQG